MLLQLDHMRMLKKRTKCACNGQTCDDNFILTIHTIQFHESRQTKTKTIEKETPPPPFTFTTLLSNPPVDWIS